LRINNFFGGDKSRFLDAYGRVPSGGYLAKLHKVSHSFIGHVSVSPSSTLSFFPPLYSLTNPKFFAPHGLLAFVLPYDLVPSLSSIYFLSNIPYIAP
jgi:hypothetical protein